MFFSLLPRPFNLKLGNKPVLRDEFLMTLLNPEDGTSMTPVGGIGFKKRIDKAQEPGIVGEIFGGEAGEGHQADSTLGMIPMAVRDLNSWNASCTAFSAARSFFSTESIRFWRERIVRHLLLHVRADGLLDLRVRPQQAQRRFGASLSSDGPGIDPDGDRASETDSHAAGILILQASGGRIQSIRKKIGFIVICYAHAVGEKMVPVVLFAFLFLLFGFGGVLIGCIGIRNCATEVLPVDLENLMVTAAKCSLYGSSVFLAVGVFAFNKAKFF